VRVRIIKGVASTHGTFNAGEVADVPAEVGKDWCKMGIAMQDKSLDGGKESKIKKVKKWQKER